MSSSAVTVLLAGMGISEAIPLIVDTLGLSEPQLSTVVVQKIIRLSPKRIQLELPIAGAKAKAATGRAVDVNPFDLYGRLHHSESTFTLATMGNTQKGEEAIEEYRRLTLMVPPD